MTWNELIARRYAEVNEAERAKHGDAYVSVLTAQKDPELHAMWNRYYMAKEVALTAPSCGTTSWRGNGNRSLRRRGIVRCRECGETDQIGGEREVHSGICENCSADYEFCSVCNIDHHWEHMCKHMFWNEGGWWDGCGSNTHSDFDHFVQPFHRFLDQFVAQDAVPFEFANELIRALQAHQYMTWEHGWMFETPRFGCKLNDKSRDWGYKVFDAITEEEYEEMFLGGAWFMTLEQDKTFYADILTLSWVLSWMEPKKEKTNAT